MNQARGSSGSSCDDAAELAPELALGILGGAQRAQVLSHLEVCPRCRTLVEEMAVVSDSLLELGPEVEPPAGFETRLLAQRQAPRPTGRSRRRWSIVAGSLLAVAAAVAAVLGLVGTGSPGFQVQHPGVVTALGGRSIVVAPLRHRGRETGQLFAYAGHPSWLFMTVETHGPAGLVTCEMDLRDGRKVEVGQFSVGAGYRSWGSTITVDPSKIAGVRLLSSGGGVLASAAL